MTEPARTTARMPMIESVTRLPERMLPSLRIEHCTKHSLTLVPGRKRGWVKIRQLGIVEVERRQRQREVEVRLVEARDGPDVGPVAVVGIGVDPVVARAPGGCTSRPKSSGGAPDQELAQHLGPEDVDAHARQVGARRRGEAEGGLRLLVEREASSSSASLRLLDELDDAAGRVEAQDAEARGLLAA